MPEQIFRFELSNFGGLNEYDQSNALVPRAYQQTEFGFQQYAPVESPSMRNIDFDSKGLSKRKGSAEEDDLTGVTVVGEELISGFFFKVPNSVQKPNVIVGKKSIYVNRTGTWAQVTNANGTAYVHDNDVTKVTFALVDQRLFIGLDNNAIQVYRTGAALDEQLHSSTTGTTVDASSASGQKVLNVASTDNFIVGDRIDIDGGGEQGYIASIQDGISLTLEDNLGATYTNEAVIIKNRYYTANTSSTNDITGNIGSSFFMVRAVNNRLVYGDGSVLVYYTPIATASGSGIYDIANSDFYQSSSRVRGITSFSPHYTNTIDENLYIATDSGWEILTDFTDGEIVKVEGARPPFNHQSFCNTRNWILYLTADKNIYAINGTSVLDIGRRVKTTSNTGSLDGMNITSSQDTAFCHYYAEREQAFFYFTTASDRFNDRCVVVDFSFGEPSLGANKNDYELYVRLLRWEIGTPATNDWFTQIYRNETDTVGITKAGKTYIIDSGLNDLGSIAVDANYYSPIFFAGHEMLSKQFMDIFFRGLSEGNYTVDYSIYLDRSDVASLTSNFVIGESISVYDTGVYDTATYSETFTSKGNSDLDRYRESLQWSVANSTLSETFTITTMGIRYLLGAEER